MHAGTPGPCFGSTPSKAYQILVQAHSGLRPFPHVTRKIWFIIVDNPLRMKKNPSTRPPETAFILE